MAEYRYIMHQNCFGLFDFLVYMYNMHRDQRASTFGTKCVHYSQIFMVLETREFPNRADAGAGFVTLVKCHMENVWKLTNALGNYLSTSTTFTSVTDMRNSWATTQSRHLFSLFPWNYQPRHTVRQHGTFYTNQTEYGKSVEIFAGAGFQLDLGKSHILAGGHSRIPVQS